MNHGPHCVCKSCFGARSVSDASVVLAAHGRGVDGADRWLALAARKMLDSKLADCGSPAEEALLAGLLLADLEPTQQHRIGAHRVDFAFLDKLLVVEVDGHAWHEKTQEQAQRDKARDRDLIAARWRVVRFTAREVFADAVGCARQVGKILGGKAA